MARMRLHRRHALLTAFSLAAGLVALAAIVLSSPPAETALLRRTLARAGATDIQLDRVRFWLGHGSASRVAFRQNGLLYDVRDLALRYHPLAALHHEADIERLTARSVAVTLDLTPASPAATTGRPPTRPPPAAPHRDWTQLRGGVPEYPLPWKIRIHELALGGTVTLLQSSRIVGAASWSLQGSLAPGSEGSFAFTIRPAGRVFSPADGSTAAGSVWVREKASGGVSGFGLSGRVDLGGGAVVAWNGEAAPEGSRLRLELHAVPLAWANPYLASPGLTFTGGTASGAWDLQFHDGSVACTTATDTAISGATFAPRGSGLPPLPALDLKLGAEGRWNLERHEASLSRFQASLTAGPARIAAELAHPFSFDLRAPRQALTLPAGTELLRLTVAGLPLAPLNRWLPGRHVEGELRAASATVRAAAAGAVTVDAPAPWQLAGVSYAAGGRRFFDGDVQALPSLAYGPNEQWIRLADFRAADRDGTVVAGRLGLAWKTKDEHVGGSITLDFQLPHFPGLPAKRGEYHAVVNASARLLPTGGGRLSRLALQLRGQRGEELMSFIAGAPVEVERRPSGEWLLHSAQPLAMKTARVPLAGLNPWLAPYGWTVDGAAPATQLHLILQPRQIRIEPQTAITLSRFHLERDGVTMVNRATVTITPSFQAEIEHHFLPTFQSHAKVAAAITHGRLSIDGARAGLFDAQIEMEGDEKLLHPTGLSGGCWFDLGAIGRLALFSAARFPGAGHLRLVFGKSPSDPRKVEFHGAVEDVRGRDGRPAPTLRLAGRASAQVANHTGGFAVDARLEPVPVPKGAAGRISDAHFGLRLDLAHLAVPRLNSRLTSTYLNLDTLDAFAGAFAPAARPAAVAARTGGADSPPSAAVPAPAPPHPSATPAPAAPSSGSSPVAGKAAPPWGVVDGRFTLAIQELAFAPYTITNVGGTLETDASYLALKDLTGELLGGRWNADLTAALDPADSGDPATLKAHFLMNAVDAGQAVHLRYPNPPAGIDGKVDLDLTLEGRAPTWEQLFAASSGRFLLSAHGGRLRLTIPKQEMLSQTLAIGGALTFSKEMRALGRLLRTLQSVPMETLQATGTLAPSGELELDHLRIRSPQLELDATGDVANAKVRDFLTQPLHVEAVLGARGDLATILDGMHLLDQKAVDGFRSLQQPFTIAGQVGQPDLHPLYDLLAKAVQGSHGSWGLLMRAAQSRLAPAGSAAPAPDAPH